jgi:hypothetical protein
MARSTYGDEPNLKLDVAPLLYISAPSQDICLGGVIAISHVSHRSTYLYWSLKKFHEVWSQKVT